MRILNIGWAVLPVVHELFTFLTFNQNLFIMDFDETWNWRGYREHKCYYFSNRFTRGGHIQGKGVKKKFFKRDPSFKYMHVKSLPSMAVNEAISKFLHTNESSDDKFLCRGDRHKTALSYTFVRRWYSLPIPNDFSNVVLLWSVSFAYKICQRI